MSLFRTLSTFFALGCLLALAACDSALTDDTTDGLAASVQQDKTPICHYNEVEDAYDRILVGSGGLAAHLRHGDLLFNPNTSDDDPSDGDLHCDSAGSGGGGHVPVCTERIVFYGESNEGIGIYAMDPDGSDVVDLTDGSTGYDPAVSPDGTKIAFVSSRDSVYPDIYVMDADGTDVVRLTTDPASDREPTWSPDGQKIAFTSTRSGSSQIFVMNADGTGVYQLTTEVGSFSGAAWSPDGNHIAYTQSLDNEDIYVMELVSGTVTQLTDNPSQDYNPAWSRDGTKIAFSSDRMAAEQFNLFVMNADGSNVQSLDYGPSLDENAAWSLDGTKLVYSSTVDGQTDLFVIGADGSGKTNLSNSTGFENTPDWACLRVTLGITL